MEGDLLRLRKLGPSFSVETLTSRFLTGNSRLPLAYIAPLRRPETLRWTWLGHIALVDGDLVGMAACAWSPDSPQPGELAVLVADGWQRRGVGPLVVSGLLEQIEAAGITHIEALTEAANVGSYLPARVIDWERDRPGGWSVRSWVTGGRRHLELRSQGARRSPGNRSRRPAACRGVVPSRRWP
jgi:GNAT superfamily N-acetyltransferase